MNLFLLRHAKAEDHGSRLPEDNQRPLTPGGEKEMVRVAQGMRHIASRFDLILSSPSLRAKRTAEIVADAVASTRIHLSKHLLTDGDSRQLIQELNDNYGSVKNVLLVGHEPFLSGLISLLATGGEKLSINFKKAGLCKLKVGELRAGRCAKLEWLFEPGQIAQIRKR